MGCNSSSEASPYVNGRPTFKGEKITKGFPEKGNGLLFRIVKKKRTWAYYNDTTEYEFNVRVTFNEDCEIEPLGATRMETMESGEVVATVTVYPTETAMFIKGRVNGFKSNMDAVPVSDDGKAFYDQNKDEMRRMIKEEQDKKKKK